MKKRYTITLLAALAIALAGLWMAGLWNTNAPLRNGDVAEMLVTFDPPGPEQQGRVADVNPTDRPDLAAKREFEMTVDPALGVVPKERLWVANAVASRQRAAYRLAQAAGKTSETQVAVTDPWTERGPTNVGGRTRGMMWDPNTANKFWAGGVSGGLWTTSDITSGGTTWTKVDDFWSNIAVTALAYDPTNTNTYYAGTGEGWFNADAVQGPGIFKSTNAGTTWSLLGFTNQAAFNFVNDLLVHPTTGDVYAATRTGGLIRSQDGGATWSTVLPIFGVTDIEIGADDSLYAAVGQFTSDGIYRSTTGNSGKWTKLNTAGSGFPLTGTMQRIELATAPSDATRLYAAVQGTGTAILGLYKSTDKGTTWSAITTPVDAETCTIPPADFTRGQSWYDLILRVDPNDANTVIVGGIDLFRSTDQGATWTQISVWANIFSPPTCDTTTLPFVHADQHSVEFKPGSSTEVVFGHDGGIDYTADVTVAVTATTPLYVNRNTDYNTTQYYSAALHPTGGSNIMLGGTQDNGTQRLSMPGTAASTNPLGGDGGFTFIDQDTPTQAIGSTTGNDWYRSFNTGTSFSSLTCPTLCTDGRFINPADYDDAANILYAAKDNNEVLRHSDVFGTTTQAVLTTALLGGAIASAFKVSPYAVAPSSTVFAGAPGGGGLPARLVKITNAESATPTYTDMDTGSALPVNAYMSSIDVGASDNQVLVTFSNYGVTSVYETTNGGTTWVSKEGNLPDMPIRWALYNPGDYKHVIVATEAGVWETDDITASPPTWSAAPSVPNVRVDMLQYRPSDSAVMASTHGRGVWTSFFITKLPVELLAFDAVTDGVDVVLSWTTGSETDNAGFEVEHRIASSAEGAKAVAAAWTVYDFIGGHGTTNEQQSYTYRFEDLLPGRHAFRLQQIGLDGSRQVVGGEIEAFVEVPGTHVLAAAYPNPFQSTAQFTLAVKETQDVRIDVYNIVGQLVMRLHDGELAGNETYTFSIDGAGLASGTYFYNVVGETFKESKDVVLVK